MIEKLNENFEIIKETINSLPRKTVKDKQKIVNFINDAMIKYEKDKKLVASEIKKLYEKIDNVALNSEIEQLKKTIDEFESLPFLNPYKTTYSIMKLDKILYRIDHFYKNNLDQVNEDILQCINCFKEAGIKNIDFNYSYYAKEYVDVLLRNDDKAKINEFFEKIYWSCSDVIMHISLNIRSIYLANQKKLDKYYQAQRECYVNNRSLKELLEEHSNNKIRYDLLVSSDKRNLIDKFKNSQLNIRDFKSNNIETLYNKFKLNDISNDDLKENISKLNHSLFEYREYLKYEFIIDDVKKKYQDKEQYKGKYDAKVKEIFNLEKKLAKINKKGIFKKDGTLDLKRKTEVNKLILELNNLYSELDEIRFTNSIYNLNNIPTLYEALEIGISDYNYLVSLLKENDNDSSKADDIINEVRTILFYPYLTIINNINILEEKELPFIISDRYLLFSLNVSDEIFRDENALNTLISECEQIITMENINKLKLNLDDVEFLLEVDKNIGK